MDDTTVSWEWDEGRSGRKGGGKSLQLWCVVVDYFEIGRWLNNVHDPLVFVQNSGKLNK